MVAVRAVAPTLATNVLQVGAPERAFASNGLRFILKSTINGLKT